MCLRDAAVRLLVTLCLWASCQGIYALVQCYHSLLKHICIAAGFWPLKFCLWIFLLGICFVMPNSAMSGYGQFARVLAGIWLLFQIIILLDFIYDVNEWLLKKVIIMAQACFGVQAV